MMVNCEWNNGGEKNFRNDIWNMLQLIIYTISLGKGKWYHSLTKIYHFVNLYLFKVLMILMNLYTIQILRESINVLRVSFTCTFVYIQWNWIFSGRYRLDASNPCSKEATFTIIDDFGM